MIDFKALMAIVGMSATAMPAAAQDMVDAGTIIPDNWNYDALYHSEAWSVDAYFGRWSAP